ncbi:MAG: UDP-glucose:(heptosyl)LPS alpha,3-glucosyltransferase [Pseudonocardiales bacterium]|jgi:UDP-glucose:(heptosyl)LPS alpha-1,3-glucosyltransferase|nr:UDP-glucose:(heptosyl)LPS alpha,3-glucosyltransferase [Pseudonocardiales bacterium]
MSVPEFAVVFPRAGVTGGVERVALDLVRYESGRRETIFVGETVDVDDVPHRLVRTARVPTALRPLAFRRAASAVLRELRPATTLSFGANCPPGDVYWVHSVHRAWLDDGGQVAFHGIGVPAAVRRLLLRHQVLLRVEREYFTNHRPRAILCTSPREVDDLERLYRVPRDIMHVVPNGFDPAAFSLERRAAHRADMREAIGAADDAIVVLMVANEWHRKGLGPLLEAVAALGDPRVRVDLVGVRPPTDYEPIAHRLGLGARLHWHGPSADVAQYHAAADVFALPTTYEPFGLVIIESMASGLPVVTSRLAGASPAIENGRNGFLLDDPRDVGELTAALQPLLDPATRERIGTTAARTIADYRSDNVLARADRIIFGS